MTESGTIETPKAHILVVDDEVDTCHNLSDILTDLGYRVDVAHDGISALELVRRNAYDVALLDYKMPGMDGLTLYREIKRLRAAPSPSWSRPMPAAAQRTRRWQRGRGRSSPSRSISPSYSTFWERPSNNRWC